MGKLSGESQAGSSEAHTVTTAALGVKEDAMCTARGESHWPSHHKRPSLNSENHLHPLSRDLVSPSPPGASFLRMSMYHPVGTMAAMLLPQEARALVTDWFPYIAQQLGIFKSD